MKSQVDEPGNCACGSRPGVTGATVCPRSRGTGTPVPLSTVAAQVRGAEPREQTFWLCRDPDCPVVYFGDSGTTFTTGDLSVTPGFKRPSSGLLCYCFGYTEGDLESEHRQRVDGTLSILETIRGRVRAGECRCDVRNPTGRCCLGELARFERSLGKAE